MYTACSFEVLIDRDSGTWLQVPEACPYKVFNRFLHRGEVVEAQASAILADAVKRRAQGLNVFVVVIAGHAVILHKSMSVSEPPEQCRQARLMRMPARNVEWFKVELTTKPKPIKTNQPIAPAAAEKQLTLF